MSSAQLKLRKQMLQGWSWRFFTWTKLPSLGFWGVRITGLDAQSCEVTMPFSWFTQNPFRSVYFGAQNGAAELSTGALALLHLADKADTSMLVVGFEAKFHKKATGKLRFVCDEGLAIAEAVHAASQSGESREIVVNSKAYLPDQSLASEFSVRWSFKRRPSAQRSKALSVTQTGI